MPSSSSDKYNVLVLDTESNNQVLEVYFDLYFGDAVKLHQELSEQYQDDYLDVIMVKNVTERY